MDYHTMVKHLCRRANYASENENGGIMMMKKFTAMLKHWKRKWKQDKDARNFHDYEKNFGTYTAAYRGKSFRFLFV